LISKTVKLIYHLFAKRINYFYYY